MALGVPYAVTDIPAFREVTGGGVGGALVPPGDDAALADALRAVLDAGPGHDDLVRAGREHARRFTWTSVAAATAELLGEVVAAGRRRRRSAR